MLFIVGLCSNGFKKTAATMHLPTRWQPVSLIKNILLPEACISGIGTATIIGSVHIWGVIRSARVRYNNEWLHPAEKTIFLTAVGRPFDAGNVVPCKVGWNAAPGVVPAGIVVAAAFATTGHYNTLTSD